MNKSKVVDRVVFDAKVSDRKILIIPVNTLRHTPYNPPARTKEGAKLSRLVESIKRYGQAAPILITEDRDVIDGNRRLAAARMLGNEFIECIISEVDKDEVFTTINSNTYPIGGRGWLSMARGGGFLPPSEKQKYDELFSLIGSYGVDLLISQNIGLNILPLCKVICAQGTKKRLEEVIMAAAIGKLTNKLNAIIRSDITREEKVAAVDALIDGSKQ